MDLRSTFSRYFTLECINASFEEKVALISLICFLTQQARKKNPDVTVDQVFRKILPETKRPSNGLLRALTCMCEDYLKGETTFPIFGAKSSKEIVDKILEILDKEMPFPNPYPNEQVPF